MHRSFSLSDFVADVQETIKPVLTAYSKVTRVLLTRNSFFVWTSVIADCPNEMGRLYITSFYIFLVKDEIFHADYDTGEFQMSL